jgi:hypothetical protein
MVIAGTVRQSISDAVARTARPVIRSAVDRAVEQLSAPLRYELDQVVDAAVRRAVDQVGAAIRPRPGRR